MGEDQFSLLEWAKIFNGNGRLLLMGEDQFSLFEWETWTNNGSSFLSIKKTSING